ncbi:MAG: endonuclease/exonuclease/phosphatase family protein [Deltaproteobacteria bacterium]|nr:endonuclease/exonuclease/phosphatase family protein [Deltaproteobacteria bacterium]
MLRNTTLSALFLSALFSSVTVSLMGCSDPAVRLAQCLKDGALELTERAQQQTELACDLGVEGPFVAVLYPAEAVPDERLRNAGLSPRDIRVLRSLQFPGEPYESLYVMPKARRPRPSFTTSHRSDRHGPAVTLPKLEVFPSSGSNIRLAMRRGKGGLEAVALPPQPPQDSREDPVSREVAPSEAPHPPTSKARPLNSAESRDLPPGVGTPSRQASGDERRDSKRIATFNIRELSREKLDTVDSHGHGAHPQLRQAAQIVQTVRPDVLVINEIDFDIDERSNARLFIDRYLKVSQAGLEGIDYPHVFFEAVNTGIASGLDLDNDGTIGSPGDCHGFGRYPGQYGMALLSRFPIGDAAARTFRRLLWTQMPGNLMPDGKNSKPVWYSQPEAAQLRLSSKSHWDVPVLVGERKLHLLISHPTPPVFDGEEDHNGRRNFDEIRLWADYLTGGSAASYIVDDKGRKGGLAKEASFVILGDLNADPFNDQAPYGTTAIDQLLSHPRVRDTIPRGPGGKHEEREYAGPKDGRTAAYGRLDYALPSRDLEVLGSQVLWPDPAEALHSVAVGRESASDHRLVWIDIAL